MHALHYRSVNGIELPLYLEPGPVTKLSLDISKPRCVELTWEPPISTRSFEFIVTYESYESNCSSQQVKSVLYDGGNESSKISMEICDLVPKTEYTFSVKGHVIRKESNGTFTRWGHWSKPNFRHIITKEDVPDINPKTSPGLYELSNSTSQMSDEDDYSLRIYWVPQNECQLHDLADHVTYTISTSNRSKQVNHPEFMAEMKVPKQKVFNVTLQAANSVGVSSSSSVITVYQSSMMGLHGSKLIIQYNKTSENCVTYADIEIVETSTDFTDLHHTLVWCEGKHICDFKLSKAVLKNKTSFVFPGDLCKIDYRYGLVTHGYHRGLGQYVNTGIQWETCTYQSGNVPDKPLQNFKVGSQREKEFVVEWTPDDCKVTEAYILEYMISFCKTDRKDRCDCKYENRYVSRETRSYKVTELQAGSHYCVQVRAVSKAGLGPVNSSTVLIETGDPDFAVIGGCMAGVCFVLALIFIIIFRFRKWFKDAITKLSVKVPETTTGYQEESVPEQISESSPMLSSADSGEESLRKVQKLQTPESHVGYNVSAINEKHYSANLSNNANKHEIINIEEDGVFDEDLQDVRDNEDMEMLCMSLKHNNHQTTDNSVSAGSDEISLNEFIEQREGSGEIYQELHSGSTVSDESDMEDIETELNENLSPEKEINSLELPQSNKTNIDTEMSDNSDDLAQNGTCQSPVIQKCAINDQKDFEQSNTANGILESKFSQSYFTSFLDTDSDVECIEDIEVDTVDNIGGYKGTDDVGVEVSESECERESDEDSEIDIGYDMGGYKKSEEVEGMSEHSSEEELENDNVIEEAASHNKPTDSVEISEAPDKKDDLLVNKNGIVRNGFIPKLSDTDKIRNNSLSGSDNSLASTAGSSHGNSSSAVSYVKAGAGDELNVKEDDESEVRDLKSLKVNLKNHTENDRKKTELISDIPALEN
ncbi:uncharacterized protein LOC132740420 [Ruditapes philippinarum]|uniref:uncharacterized protein LOC132740420 n=1 Tax=Ruditapes philippinarum TaxID=129788 RepID=UPI00295AB4ED|nr:uncharacterized protein LOC132740420 [Ruditapes philippinarum]